MHNSAHDPSESSTSHEPERVHRSLGDHLFAVAAVVWPLIVYAAYLCVAFLELSRR